VTVVNIHQGNQINPWINYPYLTNTAMKYAADTCHSVGMRYSVYNTMRELSNRCMEYWAMLSFGGHFVAGGGGGADWLQEHIRTGYLPAWSNPVPAPVNTPTLPNPDPSEGPFLQDVGMRVVAMSRWNNYYVAGLRQIKRDYGADGIYLGAHHRVVEQNNLQLGDGRPWRSRGRRRDRVRPDHDAALAQDARRHGRHRPPRRLRLRVVLAGDELHGAVPFHQPAVV
jgi:hypothetical protein